MNIGLSSVGKIYYICALLHNARICFMGIKFLSFQFICLGRLPLLFYIIMYERKSCIRISAYFLALPNVSSEESKKKKAFLKK